MKFKGYFPEQLFNIVKLWMAIGKIRSPPKPLGYAKYCGTSFKYQISESPILSNLVLSWLLNHLALIYEF